MDLKKESELVAPCGINCAHCRNYLNFKYDAGAPKCQGCRPRDKHCGFLKQRCENLREKKVEFCYECEEFPCDHLMKLEERYQKKGWPNSFVKNLEKIRDEGLAKFIEDQKEIFKCKKCGGEVSIHEGRCYTCGAVR